MGRGDALTGGDELAVLLPETTSGRARHPGTTGPRDLVRIADDSLYVAKRRRGARVSGPSG